MTDLATSFEDAWARFQALDSLVLAEDTLEGQWAQGRAQYLTFLARVEDRAARERLARVVERLDGIPGVEPFPESYWHITVKGAGFQVIKRTREDEVLREDVPRIANKARSVLADESAFEVRLGLANAFGEVAFVEVWGGDRFRALNTRMMESIPEIPRFPIDGAGFLPHVSVARFTSNDGLGHLKAALAGLRAEATPGPTLPVRRIDFIKAWLSEQAPDFDVLASYPLRSPR